MFDVYTDKEVELMIKFRFLGYLKLMTDDMNIPEKNKLYLIQSKLKEFKEMANKEIMAEASKRRMEGNGHARY